MLFFRLGLTASSRFVPLYSDINMQQIGMIADSHIEFFTNYSILKNE